MRRSVIIVLTGILLAMSSMPLWAGVWDMDLPYQGDDPQWVKVKGLWDQHWDGKNLDALIVELKAIQARTPDTAEPYLWLAKTYYLKARWERRDRQANFKQAADYAVKANAVDPGNMLAFKLLIDTVPYCETKAAILATYGDWIRGAAPLPIAEALPPLRKPEVWNRFLPLWNQRTDIAKATAAARILEDFAQANPQDGPAQLWACRANYYLGMYYTSLGQHDEKGVPRYTRGLEFGARALTLLPRSVPAHYWYQLNLARSIQNASLLYKARYLNKLLDILLFCARENGQYYFGGPNLTLGTMITKGGWVTRKGMQIAGVSLETELIALDLAEILYPDFLYIPYVKADILASSGKPAEALKILERLLTRNPESQRVIAAENHCYQRMARQLIAEIKHAD